MQQVPVQPDTSTMPMSSASDAARRAEQARQIPLSISLSLSSSQLGASSQIPVSSTALSFRGDYMFDLYIVLYTDTLTHPRLTGSASSACSPDPSTCKWQSDSYFP